MGKRKQYSVLALTFLLSVLIPATDARAYTTEDLFNDYSVPYDNGLTQDTLSIIRSYEDAKSYVAKFSNLLSLKPDVTAITTQVTTLQNTCNELEQRLDSGYYLSYEEIISLENEYFRASTQLEQADYMLCAKPVDLQLSVPEIPSFSSYTNALIVKDKYVETNYLGELDFTEPVGNYSSVHYNTDGIVAYSDTWGSDVYSIYNTYCTDIQKVNDELLITLQVGNSATLTYKGVVHSKIQINDYVKQGDLIGLAGDSLSVQLVLDSTPIDFSKKGTAK